MSPSGCWEFLLSRIYPARNWRILKKKVTYSLPLHRVPESIIGAVMLCHLCSMMISVHMEMKPTPHPCHTIRIITSCGYTFQLYAPHICEDFETHFYILKSRHASDGVSRPAFPIKAFDFVGNDSSFQTGHDIILVWTLNIPVLWRGSCSACDVPLFRHPELCLHFSAGNICNGSLFMIGDEMIDIYSMRLKNHFE